MKKVLQISNYYYPNIGGIEQVARDIANSLKCKEGEFEQKILCFNETASDGDYKCFREESVSEYVDGIEVIRCGCITKKFSQSISLDFGRKLQNLMDNFKPDIVIFHYPNPYEAFFLTKYLNRDFKFILYWHLDIVKQKFIKMLFERQTRKLLERADKIITTSPNYIEGSLYLKKHQSRCEVISNCISEKRIVITDEVIKKAEIIRKNCGDKIICFGVGRHIPYKGFKYLVEASKYLDDNYVIFIGGTGELSGELKAQSKGDSKIVFLGRLSNEDLLAYFYAMDIFCFPSITKNEAFGIALAEGMYFGKPAVTFNIPGSGVNYVNMRNITGLEVSNCDSKAYADAINKLAENKELRDKLGKAAKDRVLEYFMPDTFKRKIYDLVSGIKHN